MCVGLLIYLFLYEFILSVYLFDTTRTFSSARARYHASIAPPSEVTSIQAETSTSSLKQKISHAQSCPTLPKVVGPSGATVWRYFGNCMAMAASSVFLKACAGTSVSFQGYGSAVLVRNRPLSFTPAKGICWIALH